MATRTSRQTLVSLRANANFRGPTITDWADDLVARHGIEEALSQLRQRVEAGHEAAIYELDRRLAELGRLEELRSRSANGDYQAAVKLGDVLAQQGRIEDALAELRQHAERDTIAAERLVGLLADHRRVEELEAEVAAGTWGAALRLAGLRSSPYPR